MTKITKCDSGLLLLLQNAEKTHVDYLVDLLTDKGKGRVALSSSIKALLIDEMNEERYTEEGLRCLLREFQEYGGHSVANMTRSDPLLYTELLTDVHIKLNGANSKKKSATEKEREIILSLFGENWSSWTATERQARCTKADVVSGYFSIPKSLNSEESGISIRPSTVASAAAALVFGLVARTVAVVGAIDQAQKSIGEAYRITIPFVAHIAWLKMLHTANK